MNVFRDLHSTAHRHGAPATFFLIAALIGCFLLSWLTGSRFADTLLYDPAQFASRPWSVLTYPFAFVGNDLIGAAFGALMLWWFGASVERELGLTKFLAFFAAMTLLPLLFLTTGELLEMKKALLAGPYLPISGIIVAWATRNPTATILLAFVIPVLAKWVGWITVVAVLLTWGYNAPLMGVLAILHLGLAYAYAADKIAFLPWRGGGSFGGSGKRAGWLPRERDDQYFEEVRKKEKEREERERLRKLFEGSLKDDEANDR